MEELYNYNLDDKDIKHLLDINNDIFTLTNNEIKEKIELLKYNECNDNTIKHVLITNPYYLTNNTIDIINLIKLFKELNININDIINVNPFILNNNIEDISQYILNCKNRGVNTKKIVENLINNPYIINDYI